MFLALELDEPGSKLFNISVVADPTATPIPPFIPLNAAPSNIVAPYTAPTVPVPAVTADTAATVATIGEQV